MPEGPEVKRVADVIAKAIGTEFISAEIVENVEGIEHRFSREGIDRWVELQQPWQITKVETFGKMIKFDIQTPYDTLCAINTLGMAGSWVWNARQAKHTRLSFITKEDKDLSFHDLRCYGSFKLVSPIQAKAITDKIGHDLLKSPMPVEKWAQLQKNSKLKNKPVGPILLEQSIFSGIGNLYRAEILYLCKIHPQSLVGDISANKWTEINTTAHAVLKRSYDLGGTTIATFEADGHKGTNQVELKIYGRKKCPAGHKITRMEMKDRTMHFCDQCQILEKNDTNNQSSQGSLFIPS